MVRSFSFGTKSTSQEGLWIQLCVDHDVSGFVLVQTLVLSRGGLLMIRLSDTSVIIDFKFSQNYFGFLLLCMFFSSIELKFESLGFKCNCLKMEWEQIYATGSLDFDLLDFLRWRARSQITVKDPPGKKVSYFSYPSCGFTSTSEYAISTRPFMAHRNAYNSTSVPRKIYGCDTNCSYLSVGNWCAA